MSDELRTSNIKPYMDMISNLKMEIQSLKGHAVEVLKQQLMLTDHLCNYSTLLETEEEYRAEARALLRWEE